jgi:pimeloyl-ACP methyl ester carboxylesterase
VTRRPRVLDPFPSIPPHGATIEATAYGSGECGVVLVPQINLDRDSWQPQAELIADMGHLALAIDEDPDDRPASVRGAIQYLRQRHGISAIVLVGASTGGEAVIVANATTDATVDGTITLSAAGGADYASKLQGQSLFVVSEDDEDRFVRIARQLYQEAPDPELVEYDGSAHGQRLFTSEHGDDLRDLIRTFVAESCES